jgi:GMP synthase-like glutamine amidotransferase
VRVHVFQHVPFEGLGSIRSWLEEHRANVSHTRFYANETAPPLDGIDLLIVLGGPMSVNDEAERPWLKGEKQAVRDAIARDIPVLGICLGAQMIASALGARVYRNAVKEIGWFPIQAVAAGASTFALPPERTVFHWHGETFDLPEGAVRLARSAACANQAFQLQENVIGLQFHLETTPDGALAILENCREDLSVGPYVQSADDIRFRAKFAVSGD